MYTWQTVYDHVAEGKVRSASIAIWKLFRELTDKRPTQDEIVHFLESVDLTRLTEYELTTLRHAARALAGKTQAYQDLLDRISRCPPTVE